MANHPQLRKPKRQSISFEARLRIFCTVGALVLLGLTTSVLALLQVTTGPMLATLGILLLVLLLLFAAFIEEAIRPIQTLANVVAALREEDYSFRARGANRDDSVGQLSLEINALADTLQAQRVGALEAVALLRRVIAEMDAPSSPSIRMHASASSIPPPSASSPSSPRATSANPSPTSTSPASSTSPAKPPSSSSSRAPALPPRAAPIPASPSAG